MPVMVRVQTCAIAWFSFVSLRFGVSVERPKDSCEDQASCSRSWIVYFHCFQHLWFVTVHPVGLDRKESEYKNKYDTNMITHDVAKAILSNHSSNQPQAARNSQNNSKPSKRVTSRLAQNKHFKWCLQ